MTGTPSRAALAARNGSARVAAPPGQPGAISRPPLAADAAAHTGTVPSSGQRWVTAAAAPATADTAAATGPAAPAGITGSGLVRASSTVKNARTSPARAANRRSHPRTVDAGRPSTTAIVRCPAPAAAASSAAPITAPASARRDRHHAGSSTCVPPHSRHRDRRGTSPASGPSSTRTSRGRACPQPPSTPPHPGQPSSPPASCRSTKAPSPFTVSTTPPSVNPAALPRASPKKTTGRAAPHPTLLTVPAHSRPCRTRNTSDADPLQHRHRPSAAAHHDTPSRLSRQPPSASPMPPQAPPIGILGAV